jgi:type IV secretion system protein VirB6
VLNWFAFFALGLSIFMGQAMVQAVNANGGFAGPSFNVVGESLKYCVVMILMAIICFQAPSLAAALTGGAAMQQGIQMIQNILKVSGLRSGSAGKQGSAAQSGSAQGGVIQRGTGLPSAAGRAARSAAYRIAAFRGRP